MIKIDKINYNVNITDNVKIPDYFYYYPLDNNIKYFFKSNLFENFIFIEKIIILIYCFNNQVSVKNYYSNDEICHIMKTLDNCILFMENSIYVYKEHMNIFGLLKAIDNIYKENIDKKLYIYPEILIYNYFIHLKASESIFLTFKFYSYKNSINVSDFLIEKSEDIEYYKNIILKNLTKINFVDNF